MPLIAIQTASRKLRYDQSGNALVEFAIVFPVLLVLLFGIIQVGLLMTHKQTLTHAAREAVRYGAITNSDSDIQSAAADVLGGLSDETTITIEPTQAERVSGGSSRGEELTVTLVYRMNLLIPGVTKQIDVTSQASAFIECAAVGTCSPVTE